MDIELGSPSSAPGDLMLRHALEIVGSKKGGWGEWI
jgi:hypothetical protein